MRAHVYPERPGTQDGPAPGGGLELAARAAEDGLRAEDQLAGAERFGQVVVGAQLQTLDSAPPVPAWP